MHAPAFIFKYCSKQCSKQAELVCNSAVLLRLPSRQAAEFENNSALPELFLHQITQHEEQRPFVSRGIASGAVNAQFGEFSEPVVGAVHGMYRRTGSGVCRAEQRSARCRAEQRSAWAEDSSALQLRFRFRFIFVVPRWVIFGIGTNLGILAIQIPA